MDIVIKNAEIITSKNKYKEDILIEDGKIAKIGDMRQHQAKKIIDAKGLYVFAGFIDAHTHFDLNTGVLTSPDNFKTGTKAAMMGGTTSVLDFATQNKGETLTEALKNWHTKADDVSSCNYGFHMAITDYIDDLDAQMEIMKKQGVNSYKMYMAYDNLKLKDDQIYSVMKKAKQIGSIVMMHCENGDIANRLTKDQIEKGNIHTSYYPDSRPPEIEAEAINRFLYIAKLVDCPAYVVHLSTELGLQEIRVARKRGQTVYAETCPQYLILNNNKYNQKGDEGLKYMLAPPLRDEKDQKALWEAIFKGEIDIISTDHCSFNYKTQKLYGKNNFSKTPNGLPGVKNRAQLIYTYGVLKNNMTIEQMAELLTENPSKIFGLYPQRGVIKEGSIADITIFDPKKEEIINTQNSWHNVDYTPYQDMKVKGKTRDVILSGELVVENFKFKINNKGRYIVRGENKNV